MSSVRVSLSMLGSEGLTAGRSAALVVTLGCTPEEMPLLSGDLPPGTLPDGALLEIVLRDGTDSNARRVGSAMGPFFSASGARLPLACVMPVQDSIHAVLELRAFEAARMYLGATHLVDVDLGLLAIGGPASAPVRPGTLPAPTVGPGSLVPLAGSYDLHISASGRGFDIHRGVGGVDYRRDTSELNISDMLLSSMLDESKKELDRESRSYTKSLRDDEPDPLALTAERGREHCFRIAQVGRRIYDDILWKDLPPATRDHRATFWREISLLPHGAQLHIHNDGLVVPWNIIYDGDLPASAEEFTEAHISGFWGYRYRINELLNLYSPGRVRGRVPPQRLVCAYIDPTLGEADERVQVLTRDHRTLFDALPLKPGCVALLPADAAAALTGSANPLSDLERVIGPPQPMHLLYFLCHATSSRTFNHEGRREKRTGMLRLNNALFITNNDIRQWARKWADEFDIEPIVFLNCCEAGSMDPFGFGGLVEGFLSDLVATAVVGCSWEVPTHFAHGFAHRFFGEFMNEPGQSLGDALYGLRRELLQQFNPFGLIYAVFGNAGVRLAPVQEPAVV
jgi:hypothetical protein